MRPVRFGPRFLRGIGSFFPRRVTDPILLTHPLAWFRADSRLPTSGLATTLVGRVGTEGNIALTGGSGTYTASNPLANNQPTMALAADSLNTSDKLASFWGSLNSDAFSWWCVFVCAATTDPGIVFRAGNDMRATCTPTLSDMSIEWGPGADNAAMPLGAPVPSTCVLLRALAPDDLGNAVAVFADSAGVGFRQNNGGWTYPPPATVDGTLQFGDVGTPAFELAEYLTYDRTILPSDPDFATISGYFTTRYGLTA